MNQQFRPELCWSQAELFTGRFKYFTIFATNDDEFTKGILFCIIGNKAFIFLNEKSAECGNSLPD